jgi:hypothetical protein
MDKASYHSIILNIFPSANSRKSEIVDWLKNKNITADPTKTRAELLQNVQPFKTLHNIYELDQITKDGVIRFHNYHHTIASIIPQN